MVAGILQNLRQGGHAVVEVALVARLPRPGAARGEEVLGHLAQAGNVVVGAGQQHGASGRAGRRRVEARHEDALAGELVEAGCRDLAAVGPCVAEAEVVGDDDEEVGAFGGWWGGGRHFLFFLIKKLSVVGFVSESSNQYVRCDDNVCLLVLGGGGGGRGRGGRGEDNST